MKQFVMVDCTLSNCNEDYCSYFIKGVAMCFIINLCRVDDLFDCLSLISFVSLFLDNFAVIYYQLSM